MVYKRLINVECCDLVYAVEDLREQDISDASDHSDAIEHVPQITVIILYNTLSSVQPSPVYSDGYL